MRFLLDTHTFLWFILDNPKLSPVAKALIENPENSRILSMASIWEMSIKNSIGKLTFEQPFETFLPYQLHLNRIELLDIKLTHALAILNLPHHHRDPFDRLIIAQSMVENLPVITVDSTFKMYPIEILWYNLPTATTNEEISE